MSMDDFQCDMLELNAEFERESFDEPAFLETIKELAADEITINDEGNGEVRLSFGSSNETLKPHAHLAVELNKNGKSRVEIRFHNSTMEMELVDARLPNVYDCAEWLSRFFKGDLIEAHLHAAYIFDESFAPTITLPFQLVTSEKGLAGSLVMGISLLLPKEKEIATAMIQTTPKGATYLFITATTAMNLKGFNLDTELERLSPSISTFVKRRDTDDTGSNKQRD